jgi:hypothetical protein
MDIKDTTLIVFFISKCPSSMNFAKIGLTFFAANALLFNGLSPAFGLPTEFIARTSSDEVLPEIIRREAPLLKPMTINLHPGQGTNISFDEVGQTIETIFLDNKSFVALTMNGCLGADCNGTAPPTLVHLSMIDDIELAGVSRTNKKAAQKSLLTITTTDTRGQKFVYIFALRLLSKTRGQNVALIQFVPKPKPVPATAPIAKTPDPVPPPSLTPAPVAQPEKSVCQTPDVPRYRVECK